MGNSGEKIRSEELDLLEAADGVRLKLRVKAGGRRNGILGVHNGALKLSVTAVPEKGKANKAVLALLAEALSVPVSSVEILSGSSSPDKSVRVAIRPETLRERLAGR
jgi:uncharacterized protein (TIGR00251 family)